MKLIKIILALVLFTTTVHAQTTAWSTSPPVTSQTRKHNYANEIRWLFGNNIFALQDTILKYAGGNVVLSNAITFNGSGSGAASGTTYNNSAARTISWNTLGASPGLFYYASTYGVPNYPTDGTTQIQNAINAALSGYTSINQKPKIWFSKGYYQASGLTNAEKVDFVGEDAYFINGDIYAINRLIDNSGLKYQSDRSLTYVNNVLKRYPWLYIGDSITEGTATLDFSRDNWASLLRSAFQARYSNRDYGFQNFNPFLNQSTINTYMKYTFSGWNAAGAPFNGVFYGGVAIQSVTSGDYVQFTYTGKDFSVVYTRDNVSGSTVGVTIDGVSATTLDTKILNDVGQMPINDNYGTFATYSVPAWGAHTIRLTNLENKSATLQGIQFAENASSVIGPLLNNLGRSSIAMVDLSDDIIDYYCSTGSVVLALGVNDQLNSASLTTFKAKYKRFLDNIQANGGQIVVADFMFSFPQSNAYKTALREYALQYNVPYLDFAALWLSDVTLNKNAGLLASDGVHPTKEGHAFIANVLMKYLGLNATPQLANAINNLPTVYQPLENQRVGTSNSPSFVKVNTTTGYTVTAAASTNYGYTIKDVSVDNATFSYNTTTGENKIGGLQSYVFPVIYAGGNAALSFTTNGNAAFAKPMTANNFYSTSSTPSIVVGSAAGSGATATIVGSNQDGIITITNGTSPTVGTLCTITMSGSFAYANKCTPVITLESSSTASIVSPTSVTTNATSTTWAIQVGTSPIGSASNTIKFNYHNGGY